LDAITQGARGKNANADAAENSDGKSQHDQNEKLRIAELEER
jgi:hypothetical protein